jgi:chorismate synthase
MLRFTTAGESHGPGLLVIIEGLPAGLFIDQDFINQELGRRQQGYGRGGRMKIESDRVEVLSGVRNNRALGSPVSFLIRNKDHANWRDIMGSGACSQLEEKAVFRPRPGHADLTGAMKYGHHDMRNILERASARETTVRVAAGAVFKQLLGNFSMDIYSQVLAIGEVSSPGARVERAGLRELRRVVENSPVRCADPSSEKLMIEAIDCARASGESLGGSFEVGVIGVPPGLGSHTSWEQRLDSRLAAALMGIQAIKAVEIGEGVANSAAPGSSAHDQIYFSEERGVYRLTNNAGGIEGGMSNGEVVWARAYMKPIPTLMKPLSSVDTVNWKQEAAVTERSDVCAVPAAAVVGEAMSAYVIAQAFLEKFGNDSMEEIRRNFDGYRQYVRKVWKWEKI